MFQKGLLKKKSGKNNAKCALSQIVVHVHSWSWKNQDEIFSRSLSNKHNGWKITFHNFASSTSFNYGSIFFKLLSMRRADQQYSDKIFCIESALKRDNRTKIETALRKAGLHTTDYGRSILQKIEPPQKPRKDTFSKIEFGNE